MSALSNRKANGWTVKQTDVRKNEQDTQCTYSVTLRRLRATIFAVEKQLVLRIPSVYLQT